MDLYLSQYLDIDPSVLGAYGAFDVSIVSDLPLFIDPFLLFNSSKAEYQALHGGILRYLRFLRDKAIAGNLDDALVRNWFTFREVKQNWLGFTVLGNGGHGLGKDFAAALHQSFRSLLRTFGDESISRSSHFEKISLFQSKVGRDTISDFTTNLIKDYLLDYTQTFAITYLQPHQYRLFGVSKVRFNYGTESWESGQYHLPILWGDFVLLSPVDMLTKDDTWISQGDLIHRYSEIPPALPDNQLRAQVNNYFAKQMPLKPKKDDRTRAIMQTLNQFPELADYYIRLKEDSGEEAKGESSEKVFDVLSLFVAQLRLLIDDLGAKTSFFAEDFSSYAAALARVQGFKRYVEHQDGYRLINRQGQPFAKESEVQIFFGVIWFGTRFDVNREVNNGRGPVDYKISLGAADKSLVEFKLASNTQLKRNLEKQVEIYEAANNTKQSIKVILFYTAKDEVRVRRILKELKLQSKEWVVLIDARNDNKPSGSKA